MKAIWRGKATYLTAVVDGKCNESDAWSYRKPLPLARRIMDRFTFWNAVELVQ